ncbi:hypothetical protein PWP93_30840 [Paraburkholderia sp. A1RI-2L]|uniref:hypothetical protein n=1 Tax=Paraburkholderia sp. A1RI-2L TaxID=3028367 RepID=UPI003B7DFEF6
MKKILVTASVSLACGITQAQQVPTVGLWEHLATGDADGQNVTRHDLVFVDRKLSDSAVFTALLDLGGRSVVLCCVKVSKSVPITLADLLKKYPWKSYDVEHIKSITGWKYIYEAKLVDPSEQNYRMHEIAKSLTEPGSTSPYSAGIISGKIDSNMVRTEFSVDGVRVSYSMRPIRNFSTILCKFSVNGAAVKFTEDSFGD